MPIQQLVQKICESSLLTDQEKRFLRYLLDHAEDEIARQEYQIGREFLGLPKDWDPDKGNVRVLVARARSGMRDYFDDPAWGRKSPEHLTISRPPYMLVLVSCAHPDPDVRFWDAHLSSARNIILHTEPLFFFNPRKRSFTRYLDLNGDSLEAIDVQGDARLRGLIPCFHYQPSGETYAAQDLANWFVSQRRDRPEVKLTRKCHDDEPWGQNLILLGNSRTNRFINRLQALRRDLEIQLDQYSVVNLHPRSSEKKNYEDLNEVAGEGYTYALVTRCPSRFAGYSATILGANHGRAAQKVARYLTSKKSLRELMEKLEAPPGLPLPKSFQIVFRVEIHDFDVAEGEAEPIIWRGF
jgi:hypothetical protein